jgi:predicted dienelactone hydrolase
MRYLLFISVAVSCFVSSAVADELVKSKEGPLAVETADNLTLRDETRKKDLTCKVYYPKTGGPYPVILFSHGFGANKDAFGPIGKHWASHGYVVIHPTHADGLIRRKADPKKDDDKSPRRMKHSSNMLPQAGMAHPKKSATCWG